MSSRLRTRAGPSDRLGSLAGAFAALAALGPLSAPLCGQQWTRLSAPFGEGAVGSISQNAALTCEWHRGRVLLWAGDRRLYDWDGSLWRHIQTVDVPRTLGTMLYDPVNARTLYADGAPPYARVRAWDGHGWQQIAAGPQVLGWCYDLLRTRVVALGYGSGVPQTWELNGNLWTQRTTVNTPPFGYLAFDVSRARTVLLGSPASGGVPQETWEYDGNDWSMVQSVNGSAGDLAPLVFDLAHSELLAVGNGIIRAWNGVTWTQRASNLATGRAPQVAYDAGSGRVLWMPETYPDRGLRTEFQLFAWNGSSVQMVADAPFPTPGIGASMVTDAGRGRVILFGGGTNNASINRNEVFEWDGSHWLDRTPATMPPVRGTSSLVHDPVLGRVLMFGGATYAPNGSQTAQFGDLWSWDGTAWTLLAPSGPPPRAGALLANDTQGHTLLLGGFAGTTGFNDLWQWNGTIWSPGPPPPAPAASTLQRVAFDAARGRLVLFRLRLTLATSQPIDILEFDGVSWQFRQTVQLACGTYAAATFDPVRNVCVYGDPGAHLEWNGTTASLPVTTGVLFNDAYYNNDGLFAYDLPAQRLLYYDGQELWGLSRGVYTVSDRGPGCTGGLGTQLTARGEPAPGHGEFAIDVLRCGAGAPFLLGLSYQNGAQAIGSTCTLYLAGTAHSLVGSADPLGNATVQLPVPFSFALRGFAFTAQAASIDPQSLLGFRLSSGLRVTIGD